MGNWQQNVRRVTPYTPGEQPKRTDILKLNTNENPYPPSPRVLEAWKNLDTNMLRRYPDPAGEPLVSAIAEAYGLLKEEVFVGVGSDDVLAMLFLTFFNGSDPIVFPDITYSFYDVWAEMLRIPYETKPLDEDFCIRAEDYKGKNGGIVLANPNAPTGVLLQLLEIEDIVRANPDVIVIIDEAYIDFGGVSALPLIKKYDNVIVTQTFSKSRSLAGLRVGIAFGNPELIRYLNDVKYSFNSYTMNYPAIALGTAAVRDKAYFEETCRKIISTREWVSEEMRTLGFLFQPSVSNFLFVTHEKIDCADLFTWLRERGIFVRHFAKPERIAKYLRITIGTDDEMRKFLDEVKIYRNERA